MLQDVYNSLRLLWKPLAATDLLFKAISFVVLTPIVGLLFRGFLSLSGRIVLADADIANFIIHPIGWLTLIIVGATIVAILALEQSVLMAISLSSTHGKQLSVLDSLWFVSNRASGVFQIAARMVIRVLLLAAPFLAVGGGLYLLLLTDHDINFYLTHKPPRFWIAVLLIGSILVVLIALIVRCVVSWSIAIQLYLFENVPPGECLKASSERVLGSRKTIASWVVVWLVLNIVIASVGSGIVLLFGRVAVPLATGSIWTLVVTLGAVILLAGIVNLGTSLLAVISFAVLQSHVYDRFGRTDQFTLPTTTAPAATWSVRLSRGRVVALLAIGIVGAALVGAMTIHTVRFDDNVQITAHRGGAANAPENTLAAVRKGIEDQTDWIEIDVQESKDGVLIVAHDSDLMKVSGTTPKIWDASADELRSVDIGSYFSPDYKDERVPTLEEVLEACKGKVGLNIELKYYGHTQDLEQKVIDLVEKHGMADDVVIMSLKSDGIQKVKKLRPEWTVGLLTAVAAGDLTRANADFLAVNTKLATRPFIRAAHARGKQVYVWTVNDAATMSTMISRGADNLITDRPDLARNVLDERAKMSPVERLLVELAYLFGAVPKQEVEQ